MAWSSKYAAKFTKPLIRQLLAILQRDIAAALEDVAPGAGLSKPVEYDLAVAPINQFPAVLLAPQTVAFDEEAIGTLHETIRIYCALAVAHQNRNIIAEQIQDYVRALDEVFNSVPLSDFALPLTLEAPPEIAGTTVGLPAGRVMRLFVEGHAYDELRQAGTRGFAMAAVISLLIEMEES